MKQDVLTESTQSRGVDGRFEECRKRIPERGNDGAAKISVLVIDDNPQITALMEIELTGAGCRVQSVHSGRDGLRLLKQERFDLVITDIIMPDLDGFEVIMAINTMKPRPRIIAMTGGLARIDRNYLLGVAIAMDVQSVLYKPFTMDELLGVVFQEDSPLKAAG